MKPSMNKDLAIMLTYLALAILLVVLVDTYCT